MPYYGIKKAFAMKRSNNRVPASSKKKSTAKRSYVKAKPRARASRPIKKGPPINKCELGYLAAVAAPFVQEAVGSCVPSFPSRPSQKSTARYQGTFTVAAAGENNQSVGFVAIAPCLANDGVSVFYTNGLGYTGQQIDVSQSGAVTFDTLGNNTFNTKAFLPPPATDSTQNQRFQSLSPTVKGRIVACGLRVRYVGVENVAAGVMCVYSSPTHENLNGMGFADMTTRNGCRRVPVSREWVTVSDYATDANELNYQEPLMQLGLASTPATGGTQGTEFITLDQYSREATYPFSNHKCVSYEDPTATSADYDKVGALTMTCFISGAKAGATYEFEYIQHQEFVGEQLNAKTVNKTKPLSAEIVQDALGAAIGTGDGTKDNKAVDIIVNYLKSTAHSIGDARLIFEAGTNILRGAKATVQEIARFNVAYRAFVGEVRNYVISGTAMTAAGYLTSLSSRGPYGNRGRYMSDDVY